MTDWINWKEIEETPSLKLIAYFLIFNLALFLNKAYTLLGTSIFHPICHPFFQNCFKWQTFFFLNFAPAMRPVFLTVMFSLLCFATYSLIKNKFLNFYYCILGFFVFFLLPWFAVTYHQELFTYPEIYLFYITFIFLFTPKYRVFFLQLFFILTYYYSVISKIGSDTWTIGTLHLPLLPSEIMPFATNFVILLQLSVPFLLISNNKKIRLVTIILLELFHLYTVSFIGIAFFCITSPFIFILFYQEYEKMDFTNLYKSALGFLFILILTLCNFLRVFIPGSDYLTFEGSFVGFNMFQSRKACEITFNDKNLDTKKLIYKMGNGNQECDPYFILYSLRNNCIDGKPRKLHEILSFPDKDYNLINTENYCTLKYSAISHNDWITPVLIKDKTLEVPPIQQFFSDIKNQLIFFYSLFFFLTFIYLIFKTLKIKLLDF